MDPRGLLEERYPIHQAATDGKFEWVELLIEKRGVWVDATDLQGRTALTFAAEHNRIDVVVLLLDKGANINAMKGRGHTALHWAIEIGKLPLFNILLSRCKRKHVNASASGQLKPLYLAVSKAGDEEKSQTYEGMITRLLVKGASINSTSEDGKDTAWKYACAHGIDQAVVLMTIHGKRWRKRGLEGLRLASRHGHMNVVARLLEERNKEDYCLRGRTTTPLHYAANALRADVLDHLVEEADMTDVEILEGEMEDGKRPLQLAVEKDALDEGDSYESAFVLVEHGARVDYVNKEKENIILELALNSGNQALASLIESKLCDSSPESLDDESSE
ncbi:ankyrin repeat-containing domain protein [Xylariaceae sp. FL0594]|nr:ankyrin repeat-containing domain protein [Xylariaceae sp. FL0594]